jgi:hypothetical protein
LIHLPQRVFQHAHHVRGIDGSMPWNFHKSHMRVILYLSAIFNLIRIEKAL